MRFQRLVACLPVLVSGVFFRESAATVVSVPQRGPGASLGGGVTAKFPQAKNERVQETHQKMR